MQMLRSLHQQTEGFTLVRLVFRSVCQRHQRDIMFNVKVLAAIWNCWHLFKQKHLEGQVVMSPYMIHYLEAVFYHRPDTLFVSGRLDASLWPPLWFLF